MKQGKFRNLLCVLTFMEAVSSSKDEDFWLGASQMQTNDMGVLEENVPEASTECVICTGE